MCVGVEEHAALLMDTVLATTDLEAVKVHVLPAECDLQDLVKPRDARVATSSRRRQISGLMLRSTARSCKTSRREDAPASIPAAYFAALHTPKKWTVSRRGSI
jgi:hypothetical protein